MHALQELLLFFILWSNESLKVLPLIDLTPSGPDTSFDIPAPAPAFCLLYSVSERTRPVAIFMNPTQLCYSCLLSWFKFVWLVFGAARKCLIKCFL